MFGCGCSLLAPYPARAAETEEEFYQAAYITARLELDLGDYDKAIDRLEPIRARESCPPELLLLLSQSYLRDRNREKSLEVISEAIERYPDFVPALRFRAINVYRRQFDKGIVDLEAALLLAPDHTGILRDAALFLSRTIQEWTLQGDAGAPLRRLIEIYTHLAEVQRGSQKISSLVRLTDIYTRLGDRDKAIETAESAVALRSRDLQAQLALAGAYEAAGREEEALGAYRQALLVNPEGRRGQAVQRDIARLIRELDGIDLLSFYEELAEEFPGLGPIQSLYGAELLEAQQWEKAEKHATKVLDLWPEDRVAKTRQIISRFFLGEQEKAMQGVRSLIEDLPDVTPQMQELARMLSLAGKLDAGIDLLEELASLQSDNYEVRIQLARSQIAAGRRDDAIATLEDLFRSHPEVINLDDGFGFTALNMLRGFYAEENRYEDAHDLYDRIRKVSGRGQRDRLMVSEAEFLYRREGKKSEATELLRDVLREDDPSRATRSGDAGLDPMILRAIDVLAEIYATDNSYEQAHDLIERYLVQAGGAPDLLFLEADLFRQEKRDDQAIGVLEEIIETEAADGTVNSSTFRAVSMLTDMYVEGGSYSEAYGLIDRLVLTSESPATEGLQRMKAWVYWREKDYANAIEIMEELHGADPTNMGLLEFLAETYADAREFAKAEELLESSEDLLDERFTDQILLLRARLYRRQDKHDEAIELVERIIDRNEPSVQYYLVAGEYYYEAGRMEDAERVLRGAIALSPGDAEPYNALGYFFAEAGIRLDEALELVEKALELNPGAGHVIDSLGWVYYQQGDYPRAVTTLEDAVEKLSEPDSTILDHLGDAYAKDGRDNDARETWRKALEVDPEDEEIRAKLNP